MFNIFVELTDAGLHSIDGNVAAFLQPILVKNYPKVRKGMFVFPVNWFVQLCWNTVLKPLISSLQPDIEDKICPLYGDFRPQLFARFAPDQVEIAFGGKLDLALRQPANVLAYQSISLDAILESERSSKIASVSALHAAQYLASEKLGRLHSESSNEALRQRRTHPVTLSTAENSSIKLHFRSRPRAAAQYPIGTSFVAVFLSYLMYRWSCSWTSCVFGVVVGMGAVKYFACESHQDQSDSGSERDAGVLLRRLERDKFRENISRGRDLGMPVTSSVWEDSNSYGADGSDSPRRGGKSVVEWGACWLGEYSARCGI